ncbi:MAG: efflux RND transporter periplasmic adaptor subunit [Chloroflexi bacterium]|nr:efflux RND transporter periplasmic adaptor subunit [Chloroflexota bacterium]
MKITRRLIFILVVIITAIVAVGIYASGILSPKSTATQVVTVQRGDISASINATGKVQAKKSARLSLPVSGMVQSVNKIPGDPVNPGEVILTLRADDTQRRVRQAELVLQSRQLDLTRAKAAPRPEELQVAQANLRKATLFAAMAESNYNSAPTSQNDAARQAANADLDIARANFNRLTNGPTKEELDALQNSVTNAQLDLDSARTALTMTQLTAPFTSTVTDITVRPGELVGGFNPLATVADLSTLEIAADIDEIDVANVAVGQSVEVRLDAFPGEKFDGKVTRLYPAASTQRGSTVYSAIIDFSPGKFNVRLGMGANLKIKTIEKNGVLIVPNRALKNTGTRKAVHIVAPGQARDVTVETGVTDGANTEILSGLNEGDQVSMQ